jgi:hypothetical protein
LIPRNLTDRPIDLLAKRDASKKSEANPRSFRVFFSGQQNDLHVFKLDIDYPFYRIENGRTRRGQLNFLRHNPGNKKIFDDETSVSAQNAQHEILLSMVAEADLLDLLEKHGQENPIILTHTGFALNGNRRLAAMRKIQSEGKSKSDFSSVDVVLLPHLDDKELRKIELRLQMAQEGKANYHWLDELLTIRDNRQNGMSSKEIASAMNKKEKSIKILLSQLTLIDRYLVLKGSDQEYDVIESEKQAFKDIAEEYVRLEKSPKLQNDYLRIAFNLVAFPEGSGRSVHDNLVDLKKNLHQTIKEFNNSISQNKEIAKHIDKSQTALGEALEAANPEMKIIEIQQSFSEEAHKAVAITAQTTAIQDKANGPFNAVKEAHRLLSQIEITDKTTMKTQVRGQLKAIAKRATELSDQLEE